jgi:malate dehydrogenase (oxaloacetate-decarboxylating)
VAVDYVYRIEQPHRVGSLARVCAGVAEAGGLIGDIVTVSVGRDRSIREYSIEVGDHGAAKRMAGALATFEGVRVLDFFDRALRAHEGGKLKVDVARHMRTLQDMRDAYTPGVARVCELVAEQPALAGH